ncbi:hypothetical protein [Phormidesmis priestleyi]
MTKLLNYRAVTSLLIGVLGFHLFASRSSAAETQASITARSCSGFGNSLTKDDIELRGARLGFSLDSNTMGAAFENFVRSSLQISPNTTVYFPSPVRQAATTQSGGTIQKGIIPDGLGAITITEYSLPDLKITYQMSYASSNFAEMKFTRGNIYLSSFEHQIIGYIDVASRSPAGIAPSSLGSRRPTPIIEFVTTSDTVIGLSVIATANQERVAITQRIACDVPSTPSPTDMVVGARILLNPEVVGTNAPITFKGSGIVSGLR